MPELDGPDMREFGFTEANPGKSPNEEVIDKAVDEAYAAEPEAPTEEPPAGPVEEAPAEEEPEAQAEPAEEEEEGEPAAAPEEPEDILAALDAHFASQKEEPVGQITSEQVDQMLNERLAQLAQPPKPESKEPEEDPDDAEYAAFEAMLERTPEEERPRLTAQFLRMREKKQQERSRAQQAEVQGASELQQKRVAAFMQLKNNLDQGLQAAVARGGVQRQIVEQFVNSGEYHAFIAGKPVGRSVLGQVMNINPNAVLAPESVALQVLTAEAWARRQYEDLKSKPSNGRSGPQGAEQKSKTTALPARGGSEPAKKKASQADPYAEAISKSDNEYEDRLKAIGWE